MALCDGSAPWPDVLARLSDHWAKDDVAAFLYRLAQENILVESSEVWAHWSDIAQVPSVTSMSAGPDDAVQLPLLAHQRLLPGPGIGAQPSSALGTLFAQRETFRTFDDQPVSVETLCSVLWAAHGVARPTDTGGAWHRTTASGGNMHSARWFVAVLRELPAESATAQPVEPGIYEAHFHRGGGASLRKLEGRSEEAWHCVSDPRSLRFATARPSLPPSKPASACRTPS